LDVVVLTSGVTVALYITGQYFRRRQWKEGFLLFLAAPLMLAFGLAMSVTCCVAVVEGLFQRGGEFVRTPKGGRAVTAGGLPSRLRNRTVFAAITAVEVVLGGVMLAGAIHFEQQGLESIAIVLLVKACGFLGLAFISTGDLLPRFGAARA
jgi:hypothetical protein